MSLLMRKRSILSKIETTYGVDASATGAANAMLVSNLNITPMETNIVSRDFIRAYLGSSPQVLAAIYAKVDFEVEIAGSGTAGTAPAYGPLLRACGFSETLLATAQTGTAAAGTTTSITLAAGASVVDGAYVGMTLNTTGGTGSGQSAVIQSYVGSTKVATFTSALATGLDITTTYSIPAQVAYQPISALFESNSIYFNVDGVLHKLLGARGSVSFSLPLNGIPKMKFMFSGIYVAVADGTAPTLTLTAFQSPLAVNNRNTTGLNVMGYSGAVMSDFSADMANAVAFRSLVNGSESVVLTDRKPVGAITVEATTVASKDWWTQIQTMTYGIFSVTHGTAAGNKVKIDAPRVQMTKPGYADKDGIAMMSASLDFIPVNGNDEITISVQ